MVSRDIMMPKYCFFVLQFQFRKGLIGEYQVCVHFTTKMLLYYRVSLDKNKPIFAIKRQVIIALQGVLKTTHDSSFLFHFKF